MLCVASPIACVYIMVASWEPDTIESPAVRIISHATPTHLLAEKMKSYTFVFVALATVLFYIEYANATEICPEENCISPDRCELSMNNNVCHQQGTSCCSVVKPEYRTHCRHHAGVCMKSCASLLQRNAVDCINDEVCCVLI